MFQGKYFENYRTEGKSYINGKLEFEGEYLFNKKFNGRGYDENGNVIYKLINGKGNVRLYNYEGYLIYEGEYFYGLKNGKGKEYSKKLGINLVYEGEYLNGKRWNGKGEEYDENGDIIYEGEYLNGKKWNGKEYNYDSYSIYNKSKVRTIFEGNYSKEEESIFKCCLIY